MSEDIEQVRKTEAFLYKRATDDGSISTFANKKGARQQENVTNSAVNINGSPTKKQRVNNITTVDAEMENVEEKEIHTMEILLTTKDQEILSLRQRLEALSASGVQNNKNVEKQQQPDSQDRSPSDLIGLPPGLATDPGDNL